jgi:hypothetical protein
MNLRPFHLFFGNRSQTGPSEPDFLCVGMEKAATSWLYDQLRAHPDFWMPPVKELRYLHMYASPMDDVVRVLERQKASGKRAHGINQTFLEEADALAGQPRDLERYGALFRFKGKHISGDISPGYWRLRPPDIATVAAHFYNLRVLLMVRDPVQRAWSHISMQHRRGAFDAEIAEKPARFSSWFARSPVKRATFASRVPQRWTEFAPKIPFRHFFFDDVVAAPQRVRAQIIDFLGGNPRKKSRKFSADYNRKADFAKLPLSEPVRAVLIEQLADEIRDCARVFGGPAEQWPARYGL